MDKGIEPLLETAAEALTSEMAALELRRKKLAKATAKADAAASSARKALARSRAARNASPTKRVVVTRS